MSPTPDVASVAPLAHPERGEVSLGFTVEGARWIGVSIGDPQFGPAVEATVNLLDSGAGRSPQALGDDAGREATSVYPEVPDDLPPGIDEVYRT